MKTSTLCQSQALALCFEGAAVPEWVQLTPPGPMLIGRDGRKWTMSDPTAIVTAFNQTVAEGYDLPVDFEHSTHVKGTVGEPAPAVGWLKQMEVRDGALWGRIEWNNAGHTAIASQSYRYISPGFHFHPQTLAVTRMVSAGLTNAPNFKLPALNREDQMETDTMDKAVLEALGLALTATAEDAVAAIKQLKADKTLALNSAQTPDPALFVPKADHQLALNRLTEFDTAEKARAETAITASVDAAIAAGKVSPASKEYHLASCRSEGGLDRFNAFIGTAPVIAPAGQMDGKTVISTNSALSPEDLAVCRQLGMDPATFKSQE
jgi:phage I-like protein